MSPTDFLPLGDSGLKVSRLCLGCMSYGSSKARPWILDEDAAVPFYQQAIETGINFFDTADLYSQGMSEEVTGRTLKKLGVRREQVVIATKVFYPTGTSPNECPFAVQISPTRIQAAKRLSSFSASSGTLSLHSGIANGQRG